MTDKPTHLKLLDDAKAIQSKKDAKDAAYKKRAKSKRDFYSEARINKQLVEQLKAALLSSALIDGDKILAEWTDEMIQEIVDSIVDDGPVNK